MTGWCVSRWLRSTKLLAFVAAAVGVASMPGCGARAEKDLSGSSGASAKEGPCRPDGTCSEGYVCIHESVCTEVQPCCKAAGGIGQYCLRGGVCNDGLACSSDGEFSECVTIGDRWHPCRPDGGCDAGLVCTPDPMCGSEEECCVPVGGLGERCPEHGSCNDGLVCGQQELSCSTDDEDWICGNWDVYCDSGDGPFVLTCCQTPGRMNGPCGSDGSCDGTLSCVSDMCRQAGGESEYCYGDGTCDEGLQCRDDPGGYCSVPPDQGQKDPIRCCLIVGSAEHACRQDDTCDEGLECVDDVCTSP